MSIHRDLEFLYEVGSLKNVQRGWKQHLASDVASDLEHTMRVAFLALMLSRHEGNADEQVILKMALMHDIAETRTSDHSYVQKVYVQADEAMAAHELLADTALTDMEKTLIAFEQRDSKEAKIVKDADNLDVDLELKELEERGHQLPVKWRELRRFVRDNKLYTESAKQFWDAIQTSDPSSWHIACNKWLRVPKAGL